MARLTGELPRASEGLRRLAAWLAARRLDVALAILALALAYLMKRHYSTASADELRFVLAPTAALTGALLGRGFVWVPDAGYVSEELSILVSPACAGVNFLVVAFVVLAAGYGARLASTGTKLAWLAAAAAGAYLTTLAVNAARIALSVLGAHLAAQSFGLSFQAVHRALGVVVYLGGLFTLVAAAEAGFRGTRSRPARSLALALVCYLGMTLAVPLVRGAGSAPEYWEHARAVVPLSLGALASALGMLFALRHPARWVRGRAPRQKQRFTGVSPLAPALD